MRADSWLHLAAQDPRFTLPQAVRDADPRGGRDCGWVEQMTPFVARHAAPGAWVLDPFCGFGSTLVAAAIEGRPAIGVERDAARAALARQRLALLGLDAQAYPVLTGDVASAETRAAVRAHLAAARVARVGLAGAAARTLPAEIALCLTNVPYFGCDPDDAGPAEGDLYAAAAYAPYLEGMRAVFAGVHALLADGGWCVAMAQNLRLGGRFVPLAWDLARLLDQRFVLHDERVLVYARPADAPRGPAADDDVAATNRAHEYALVCRKRPLGLGRDTGLGWLRALREAGFHVAVHGGFARGDANAPANDLDLLVAGDDAELSRLLRWLDDAGFALASWNAALAAPMSRQAIGYRHFFRARRLAASGELVQLDVAAVDARALRAALREDPTA